jgi:hypothetical protein
MRFLFIIWQIRILQIILYPEGCFAHKDTLNRSTCMPADREQFLRFPLHSVIVMFLAFASMNLGYSMIIPLEKGNVWNYSYTIHQLTDTCEGRLSLSIDSVATLSGLNDTTYFRLAIIDSGIANDSSLSNYRLSYNKHFYACHDTLYSLDTFASPGFSDELLLFYTMSDTSYKIIITSTWSGSCSRRTDSTSITVGTQQFEAYSRVTDSVINRLSTGGLDITKKNITLQWINRIGTAYFYDRQTFSFGSSVTIELRLRTYTLESFNDTPIPPISITSIKAGQLTPMAVTPMVTLNKIVYLKKSVPKNIFAPTTMYFNLRGQKLGWLKGGQLMVEKRVIHP